MSFPVDLGGQEATIAFSGTVEQISMKGEIELGDYGSGSLTGERE